MCWLRIEREGHDEVKGESPLAQRKRDVGREPWEEASDEETLRERGWIEK